MPEKIQVLLGINKLLSKSITESEASGSGCRWKMERVFPKKSKCSLLLKYFSLTATLDPRSHYISLAAGIGPPTAPGTTTFLINMHIQYPVLSSPLSTSTQRALDFLSFLFCIIDEWKLCVESRPTHSLWHLAQFALNMRAAVLPTHATAALTSSGSWQDSLQQQLENHK